MKNLKAKIKKPFTKLGKRKTIILLFVIAIVVLLIAAFLLGGKRDTAGIPVSAVSVEKMDLEETVSIKGLIQGSESAEVSSALNYEIEAIYVKEGDTVTKDQIIAVLDSAALGEAYSLAETKYQLAKANYDSSLRDEQIAYDSALGKLAASEMKYNANKELYEAGAVSHQDFILSQTEYLQDKATVAGYNVSGGRVKGSVSQQKSLEMEAEVLAQAKKDLEQTYIKSPISGTVTRVNAKIGRLANDTENKAAMFVIENLESLEMKVKVSEYDIGDIKVGQTVSITADVLKGKTAEGVVSRISPTGENKDTSTGEMVIPVSISVSSNDAGLIAGVTAKAKILLAAKNQVLAVPLDAILEDTTIGQTSVFVITKENTLKSVKIKLGIESEFYAEVLEGKLAEGDKLVQNPTFQMTDGMTVTVLPDAAAAVEEKK